MTALPWQGVTWTNRGRETRPVSLARRRDSAAGALAFVVRGVEVGKSKGSGDAMGLIQLLGLVALLSTVASAAGKLPLWVPVFVLCVIVLLQVWR